MLSARELEEGSADSTVEGQLGDGNYKWQLFVSADRPILVMSLLLGQSGNLTNLSTVTRDTIIRGGPGNDELWGGNGDDVIDPGDNSADSDELDIVHGSAGDDRIAYTGSGANGYQQLEYSELSEGVTVTIDGAANLATVDKGSAGTDTIVDIANPLDAGGSPPFNGVFELRGTPFDDTFDLALGDEQWMDIAGNAGADTFNIESGAVRIDYETSPAGVDVDLDAGRTDDDGFGDSDTINGSVWGVAGSEFSDEIRGSDNNESFVGRAGNDRIDGRGGRDRVNFGPNNPRFAGFFDIGAIDLDLAAGTVTGTWNGKALSYTLRNIEWVQGGPGNDTLRGTDGNDILDGGAGNDVINPGDSDGNDLVYGSPGSDRIVYTDSTGDRAYQSLNYFWSYDAYYDHGLRVTVDGVGNRATVSKGPNGTDTIVDIANPMSRWGFGIEGTSHDDVFTLTVDNGQWMQFSGGPGDDTFNISGGGSVTADGVVRADYLYPAPRNGIEVDLASGRASDDGFGDVDTFNGRVGQFRGTDLSDSIRGSDNDEFFIGRRGNDTIDGRGGRDTLQFDRTGVRDVVVDLAAGTATGIWGDSAYIHRTPWFLAPVEERAVGSLFTYEVSNIEVVWGSRVGRDRLLGSERDERLEGRQGDDVLDGRGGNDDLYGGDGNDTLIGGGSVNRDGRNDDKLEGGAGNDTFVIGYGDGFNTIHDFTNGEDRIDLSALGFASYSDLRAVISLPGNGTGTWIDLSRYGGGGVSLWQYFDINGLDASDFLL
jgi:Ca2+-binding RTX toxin-like protein